MNRLSEGAIELNDVEVFNNCSYSCYSNLADALNKLAEAVAKFNLAVDRGLYGEKKQEAEAKGLPTALEIWKVIAWQPLPPAYKEEENE